MKNIICDYMICKIPIFGTKLKMSSFLDHEGNFVAVTGILIHPVFVLSIANIQGKPNDQLTLSANQSANQNEDNIFSIKFLNFLSKTRKKFLKTEQILFDSINSDINCLISETKMSLLNLKDLMDVNISDNGFYLKNRNLNFEFFFKKGNTVTVQGRTKGTGFTGVMKRFGFKGGPKSHGSKSHRRPGSIGAGTNPGCVKPGKRMAGRDGYFTKTQLNVEIFDYNSFSNILLVKGSLPGKEGTPLKLYFTSSFK